MRQITLNPLLIPGIIILKVRGRVLKAISLDAGDPIPDEVDEIVMCLSDYEDLVGVIHDG